jgi:tetratricopeptide (TPR) repeat protein
VVCRLAVLFAGLGLAQEPLQKALELLRQSKTAEARAILAGVPEKTAELEYQIARSHLLDFYQIEDPLKRRASLALAMDALGTAVKKDGNHIPSLRAKAVIHARAELLYYDPNLAYEMASRIAKLEPNSSAYILNLTEWMSGEVRFTHDSSHRVPHDPLLGLDRSIPLLERVLDSVVPYSPEESAAFFTLGKTLSRRGDFAKAIPYFQQLLRRTKDPGQIAETHREIGTCYYRTQNFIDAAASFYQALQWQPKNPVDQWMLKITLDQIPEAARPPMPKDVLFPATPVTKPSVFAFQDIAPALGVNRFDGNGTCAWGDYDGDGDLDLFLAGSGTFMAVYRNDGKKFTEVTAEVGLSHVPSGYSLNVIDYDNDGKLDLYVTLNGWSGPAKNKLFRNVGGKFEDVSAASGADDPGDGFVSVWGDLDNDGYLDLVIANGVLKDGSTPQVYRNTGAGKFVRVEAFKEPPQWGAIGAALGDYDKDGDLDILINGLNDAPNRLYRNDGIWKFTEVTRQAGVMQPPHNGFVCFFFDYNNDGWPDILTTSLAPWPAVVEGMTAGYSPRVPHQDSSRLFRNNGNGTFTDATMQAKLFYPMGTMGAGVADLDNDGYLDIYFGTGDPQLTRLEPNRFFRNNGDGTFSDQPQPLGVARPGNKGHGVTFLDFDNDGDLDVYAQLGGHYPGDHAYNALYENRSSTAGNHWLQLDLKGVRSNRFAVGTQVTVRSGQWQAYREVKGSEGFGATNPYRVHFGLGARPAIEMVEIRWPSGATQQLKNVKADRVVSVTEAAQASAAKARGVEFAKAGDYRMAEPLFKESCEAKEPDGCYFWGRALYAIDRHAESIEALRKAEGGWREYMGIGQAHEALNQPVEAEAAFVRAINLRSKDRATAKGELEPDLAYAVFLYRQGRIEASKKVLESANQKSVGVLYQLARAQFQTGELERAVASVEKLLVADPSHAAGHELASRIYYRLGKTDLGDRHAAAHGSATSK